MSVTRLLLPLLLLAFAGCSRAKTTAWRDHMVDWFKNERPTEPPRRYWEKADDDLFQKRVGHADAALLGVVRTVAVFHNHDQPQQLRIAFVPTEVLHGSVDLDEQKELIITAGESPSPRQVRMLKTALPGRYYLLLIKKRPLKAREMPKQLKGWKASLWRPPPPPKPRYRWALYPPERALVEQVRDMYGWLKKKK